MAVAQTLSSLNTPPGGEGPECAKPGTHIPALLCHTLGVMQVTDPFLLAPCLSEAWSLGFASQSCITGFHSCPQPVGSHAACLHLGALLTF